MRFRSLCTPGFVVLPALVAVLLAAGCRDDAAPPTPASGTAGPRYLNHDTTATYVGIDACARCHVDKYETFVRSQMGRSFKPASLDRSAADWRDPQPVYDPANDLYYLPFHEGQDLFMMEYRLDGRDTVYKRIERIDYIVGSGHHTNSHMMEENGYFYQMPLTYYVQEGRWDLPPNFDSGNPRFSRPIIQACMTCHNAMPDFVEGSENRFAGVPHGIDCERCHGPGSLHVEAIMAGRVVNTQTDVDYTIVNPAKLPVDRQLDVCARCHMQGANVFRPGKDAADFRPGMRLADVQNVFWPRFVDSTAAFIMASHPDRMAMSACFQGSHDPASGLAPMTCLTCHDPHLPIEQMAPGHYRQACQSCHTGAAAGSSPAPGRPPVPVCTEDEAVRARVADECHSCHMPRSGATDIPHVVITDHFIRTPAGEKPAPFSERRLVRMASLIDPDPAPQDVAAGYLTYYEEISNHPDFLDSAAVLLDRAGLPEAELAPARIRVWFLQKRYAPILELAQRVGPKALTDGWTWYRVGEAAFQVGRYRDAVRYLEEAIRREPQNLRFLSRLAVAYTSDGQLDVALARLDALLRANPRFEEAYNNRGFARVLKGDAAGAEADFHAALALDPNAEQALANLASLYYNTGRAAEARPLVDRLLRLRPGHAPYEQFARLLDDPAE